MLKYLAYAVQGIAVIGGVAGGLWLKSASAPKSEEPQEHAAEAQEHAEAEKPHEDKADAKAAKKDKKESKKESKKKDAGDKKKNKGKDGHGGGHGKEGDDAAAYGYMKFSRQFVVPVMSESGVASLVVLDINIEVPPDETETIYVQEPKLRDALLSTLLSLSNSGAFSSQLLEQANLDMMRTRLLESARAIIGESAQNVLILNITRQDV
jgi:hypothetical protein